MPAAKRRYNEPLYGRIEGSSTVVSHGWATVSLKKIWVGLDPDRNVVALAGSSSSAMMRAGADDPPSLFFQTSQGLPVAGSM